MSGIRSPQVSVLMPMKNAVRYVGAAARSILEQDFGDLELIVVDDGSSDGSRAQVARIDDSRLKIIDGPCRGIAAAWNAAFGVSIGDIVLQCDADDLFPPGRIARHVEFLQQNPGYVAVAGAFAAIERSGRLISELVDKQMGSEEITGELLNGVTRTHLGAFSIRRSSLERIGGKRDFFTTAEDLDLQFRLAGTGRVWFERKSAYLYRIHDASITHTQGSAQRQFFEGYARELAVQRRESGADDLQRGTPRAVPEVASSAHSGRAHMLDLLIGSSWSAHQAGDKRQAVQSGLRAVVLSPLELRTWRNLLLLLVKPS